MNRWLLTALGIAAAGSAVAATTASPPATKAKTPGRAVAVRPASVRPTSAAPKVTRPLPTPATAVRQFPFPTTPEPEAAASLAPPTPTAAPVPTDPTVAPSATPVIVEDRDVAVTAPQKSPVRLEDREVELEIVSGDSPHPGPAGGLLTLRPNFTALGLNNATPAPLRKAISLDVANATPVEAIEALVRQAGSIALSFDKGIPNEARITLKVKQVSAAALLGLITQNAGLDWSMNVPAKGQTAQLRVMKATPGSSKTSISFLQDYHGVTPGGIGPVDVFVAPGGDANHLTLRHAFTGEQRLSLECPHCKAKNTIIRQRHQPKCPKCTRTFQNDWQFCPIDGSKRPGEPNEWKFCPSCGKKVEVEKAAHEGSLPILGDLPMIGQIFRKSPAPKPATAPNPNTSAPRATPETPMAAKPQPGTPPATPPVPAPDPKPVDPAK